MTVLDIIVQPPCRVLTAAECVLMNTTAKTNTWGERKLGVSCREGVVIHPPLFKI